jgi:GDPmannose 4,6-dehydratase
MPLMGYDEESKFHPRSPYGAAKLYAYWITRNYREAYGLHASNGILFNHETPRRGMTFVTRKITSWIGKNYLALTQQTPLKPLVLGNLDAKRDWGHGKDYVEAMYLMMQQDEPDDYVIATGETYSVRDFVEEAFRVPGIEIEWRGEGLEEKGFCKKTDRVMVEIDPVYFRPSEVEVLLGNPSKAKKRLNWEPKYSFKDLVVEMTQSDISKFNTHQRFIWDS